MLHANDECHRVGLVVCGIRKSAFDSDVVTLVIGVATDRPRPNIEFERGVFRTQAFFLLLQER